MTPSVATVLETARSLTRDQIADVAYHLLLTLDDKGPDINQETVHQARLIVAPRQA
jgi:hypothetical protein